MNIIYFGIYRLYRALKVREDLIIFNISGLFTLLYFFLLSTATEFAYLYFTGNTQIKFNLTYLYIGCVALIFLFLNKYYTKSGSEIIQRYDQYSTKLKNIITTISVVVIFGSLYYFIFESVDKF